jgi:hypothetical protein
MIVGPANEEQMEDVLILLERIIALLSPISLAAINGFEGQQSGCTTSSVCEKAFKAICNLSEEDDL